VTLSAAAEKKIIDERIAELELKKEKLLSLKADLQVSVARL
jgi:hypothetical protein